VYKNPEILGKQVEVYRNLTKNCYSVRHKGKVIAHEDKVVLTSVECRVQPAGRAKVLKEKRKNVHAYVKGKVVSQDLLTLGERKRLRYNPYEADHFFEADSKRKVHYSSVIWLDNTGMFLGEPTITTKENRDNG
jgi:hypothetical protein